LKTAYGRTRGGILVAHYQERHCPRFDSRGLALDDESLALVARWREGDEQAAAALFERYAGRLVALTRQHLSLRVAQRVDPEDVVQSVCRSFFAGAREGRFVFEQSGDLWRLLVAITLHKVQDEGRKQMAEMRTVAREKSFGSEQSLFGLNPQALAQVPGPAEAAALADLLEQVLSRFKPAQRRMVELRLQGYPIEEIADETGHCRHTVTRVLKRARQELEQA
jgi:RNA polymerase sigma factor (sigma-70 family)